MDEDDFDLGGFDEAYSPDDFSQADMDFATAVGMQTADAGSDDDSAAQFIANQFAKPQAGMNRSNIRGTANFDPQFAAAFDISRGLDPTNNFGGTGGLAVPSYLRPQVQGDLVLNEAGDRMMYGSGLEKFAQETAPELVRGLSDFGIGSLIRSLGTTISDAFTDAKSALGFDGAAQGGLKVEDLQPAMGTLDPSDRFLGDMSQQGANIRVTDPVVPPPTSVTTGAVPQVSPLFDQFGNPYRSRFLRDAVEMAQQSQSGGIASVTPTMVREANTNVADATRSLQGPPAFINKEVQRIPGGFNIKGTFDYPGTDRDTKLDFLRTGPGTTEQDTMDAFLNNMYSRQTPIEKQADASQFLNPQAISQGLNYFAGPQIQDFFRGVTKNPGVTTEIGPRYDRDKQKLDDNIFTINIPLRIG